VSDPARAKQIFEREFEAADNRFDLPRCHDLIEVLRERQTILHNELETQFKEQVAYLTARGDWADDYFRTARYLERPVTRRAIDNLLLPDRDQPSAEWMLQLHARGGMGKTIFLRWLVARHCIPRRIPCARIDFDDPRAPREPWRVLSQLAYQ